MGKAECRRRIGQQKLSWLDMLENRDSTKMSQSKMLETGKGREDWSAADHGVAEQEMPSQLKNGNNSVSHMSIKRRFSSMMYGILYIPIGKLDASL